jgi:hypothetical protein
MTTVGSLAHAAAHVDTAASVHSARKFFINVRP